VNKIVSSLNQPYRGDFLQNSPLLEKIDPIGAKNLSIRTSRYDTVRTVVLEDGR